MYVSRRLVKNTYIAGTRSSRLLKKTTAVTALNFVARRKVVTDLFSGPAGALDSVCVCVCVYVGVCLESDFWTFSMGIWLAWVFGLLASSP